MNSEENKYKNIRIYRKPKHRKQNVQLSNRETKKHQTTTSNETSHIDGNHQPDGLASSSNQLETNHQNLSVIEMTSVENPSKDTNLPASYNNTNNVNEVFENIFSNSSSFTKPQNSSKLKRKILFKNLAFALFLTLLIITLIVTPIVIVYYLASSTPGTTIDPCKSSRTLTFDDIGTNPFWVGSSGYGGIPPGYGGFTWLWANYANVSRNTVFGTALVSGGDVAYIDNTTPSNKLTISTNNSALFYICSMVVASVITVQTSFTVWGIYSNTVTYTMNVTINSTTSSTLNFSQWKIAVDTIEMFGYGNIFAFDNLVMSGP